MKKRICFLLAIVMASGSLTACGSKITVTSEQNDLLAEYAAGVMLKYSFENEWNYNKVRQAKKGIISNTTGTTGATTPEITKPSQSQTTTQSPQQSTKYDPMALIVEGLGITGCTVNYIDYVVADKYPEDGVLSMPSPDGKKLVVLKFNITNTSGRDLQLNTTNNSLAMKLIVNNGSPVSENISILNNDIINISNLNLTANASKEVVAIFAVDKDTASEMNSIVLSTAISGGKNATFTIK